MELHYKAIIMGTDYGINDLHPLELTTYSVLNGSLDNLNDNFEQLNKSQTILLTRLKLIEERIKKFQSEILDGDGTGLEKNILQALNQIKDLKKRMRTCLQTSSKVDARVERLYKKIESK